MANRLTRTGSLGHASALANTLPDEITSSEDVSAAIRTCSDIAASLGLTVQAAPVINPSDNRLTSGKSHAVVKEVIPPLTKAFKAVADTTPIVAKVLATLFLVVQFYSSETYRAELVKDLLPMILADPQMQGALASGSGSSSKRPATDDLGNPAPRKKPSRRDNALQLLIHYLFHQKHNKRFNSGGFAVVSENTSWLPATVSGLHELALEDGSTSEVWRPEWTKVKDPRSIAFIEEIVAAAKLKEGQSGEQSAEANIRKAADVYFKEIGRSVTKKANEERAAKDIASKAIKKARQRTTKTLQSMREHLPSSIVMKSREGKLIAAALRSGALEPRFWDRDEPHSLEKTWTEEVEADGKDEEGGGTVTEERGYDAWSIYADRYRGEKVSVSTKVWMVEQPQWWSEAILWGFWTVWEETAVATGSRARQSGFSRTPLFHVPTDLFPQLEPDDLPPLIRSNDKALTILRDGKSYGASDVSAYEISRSMVDPTFLEHEDFAEWVEGLFDDPPASPEEESLPTLKELLRQPQNKDLGDRVIKHCTPPEVLLEADLSRLWAFRNDDSYVDAVRSRNVAGFFDALDALNNLAE